MKQNFTAVAAGARRGCLYYQTCFCSQRTEGNYRDLELDSDQETYRGIHIHDGNTV